MYNSPINFNDPDGDCPMCVAALIGAGIGGVGNLAIQAYQGNISSIGDGFAAFGIGAVAGGAAGFTGGASLAATGAGTTFWGAVGAGALSGAAGGATAGLIQGTGNALYFQDASLGEALGAGAQGALYGGLTGAALGGILGGATFKAPGSPGPAGAVGDDVTVTLENGSTITASPGRMEFPPANSANPNALGGGNVYGSLDDVVPGLPRGVTANWGKSFNYRHGGNMSAIQHITHRHAYNSGFDNVSRFSQNTSVKMIKNYVNQATKYGTPIRGGFEYNLGRTIGTGSNGLPAASIRVFVRDGWVRTAFPIN